ncbi:hypothetical protein ACFT2C_10270 [Promicromonospora sp. NPDC057138]|uniref:hypothetical protein n=1 Tax=Promicromonospora sp. NPDC057138 TaxID=3346031 RepID=UPI00362D1720
MTSSNAIAEPALVVDLAAEHTPEAVDGDPTTQSNTSPFEFLPTGDAFGVCDLDGECR